jgi:uncharacterized protein (TIGR02391 family)
MLGISGALADRVSKLVLAEDWMFGGGWSSDEGWSRSVTEHTRFLRDAKTVGEYLQVEAERVWSPHAWRPAGTHLHVEAEAVEEVALAVSELHPSISFATQQLLADGHYDDAVRAAAIAFEDRLRASPGMKALHGQSLVGKAFGGDSPAIRIASDPNEQRGWHQLAEGVVAALRNPAAHRNQGLARAEALEQLATMSLLLRRSERPAPDTKT